ncbi:hypothetical protein L1887_19075 [Cichorium endivia]|nr:hypothetical protein L1887_19075 [Cichorium endivia]
MHPWSIAQGPGDDLPAPAQQFAQFGAGCFRGVELVRIWKLVIHKACRNSDILMNDVEGAWEKRERKMIENLNLYHV